MANGLSKIIKKARKANDMNILARFAKKKFQVEELEDRIAPAGYTLTCAANANVVGFWNADGTATPDYVADGDGFILIDSDDATDAISFDISVDSTAISTTADGVTSAQAIDIKVNSISGGSSEIETGKTLTIITNAWVDDIDLSALTIANGASITINIVSGVGNFTLANDDPDTFSVGNAETVSYTGETFDEIEEITSYGTTDPADLNTVVNGAVSLSALNADAAIGDIILPTIAAGETATIDLIVASGSSDGTEANADENIGAIYNSTSTAGTLTLGSLSKIYGNVITSINTSVIGNITIGGAAGDVGAITSAGAIGNLTIAGDVTGNMTGTSIGDLTLGTNAATTTVTGNITASTGSIGTINEVAAGATVNISGNLNAATQIGIIGGSAPVNTLSGSITAGTTVNAITTVGAITGAIQGQTVGAITTTNSNVTGGITASGGAGTVGIINIGSGSLGAVTASGTTGSIGAITCGAISGNLSATDTDTAGVDNVIGAIDASGAISGDISAYTIGTIDSDAAISGDITLTGGSANAIGATDITGAINITGDLTGDIITDGGSGGIADLNVVGNIDANITASGGSAVIDATAIVATGSITIQAEDDMTLTLTGGIDGSGGADTIAIKADSDSDDGGDLVVVVGGQIDAGDNDDVDLTGENINFSTTSETQTYKYVFGTVQADDSITIGTLDGDLIATTIQATDGSIGNIDVGGLINVGTLTAPDTDANNTGSIGNLTAGESITISTALTADQTIGNIEAAAALSFNGITVTAPAGLGTLDAGGALDFGTISVTAGGVGAITSGTTLDGVAITVAAGNLGAITAGTTLNVTGNVAVTTGNIGNISSLDNMTIAGNWTATAGSIGTITAGDADNDNKSITITTAKAITAGTTMGAISATGDIASTGTSTIVAGAQAVASGVIMSMTDNDVVYAIESDNADASDTFAVTLTISNAADNKAAIVITRAGTGDLNLSLTTSDTDETVNTAEFDLATSGLSVASGAKTFGVVTVEGDIAGAINLGTGSAATAILVQDQISGIISVDSLDMLAGENVDTAADADALTVSSSVSGADPNASAIAGTYALPIASGATNEIVAAKADGKFTNDGTSNLSLVAVTGDAELSGSVSYVAGVLTGATGGALTINEDITTTTDFTDIAGAITVNGSVTGDLTFGEDAGNITIGGAGEVISGALTFADMTGNITITGDVSGVITAGEITGDVSISAADTISNNVTIDSVSGTLTLGDVATGATVTVTDSDYTVADPTSGMGAVTIGSVAVGSTVALPESGNGGNITITTDMLGTLNVTNADGAAVDITITQNFGSILNVDGSVGNLTLNDQDADDVIGSATSTIIATGAITTIQINDGALAVGNTETTLMADITVGEGALSILGNGVTTAYVGTLNLGATDGAGDFGVDTDGNGALVAGEKAVILVNGSAAVFGSASYDATNGQTFALSNIVLLDTAGATTLAVNGDISGNIYIGDTSDAAITVAGVLTGSVIVDDDADVSALGLTAGGDVIESFNGGAAKANTTATFAITAESMGDITVEGEMLFDDIVATDGSIGNITALDGQINGDTISATDILGTSLTAGNIGNITSDSDIILNTGIIAVDGNLGLIVADGDITSDITVDESYTFTGIINTDVDGAGLSYSGDFDVEATIGKIMLDGGMDVDDDAAADFNTDDEEDFRDAYEDYLATDFMISLGVNFAMVGYTSVGLEDVTITGATTYVTLNAGDMIVYDSVVGSTVSVDETDGNVATTLTVDGDLAGTVELVVTDSDVLSNLTSLTVGGDLSGVFSADGQVTTVTVDGELSGSFTALNNITALNIVDGWSGLVSLSNSNPYLSTVPTINTITVDSGDVATATLDGATYLNAIDANGEVLAAQSNVIDRGAVFMVPNSNGDGVGQYLYINGRNVEANVSTLFGQVSGFELVGKGSTQVVSIEAAATPEVTDMLKAAKYGKAMVKGREIANDFIDFDEVGSANLPDITVAPRVQLSALVVDGNVGDISDIDSNIKNVFVSGTADDILSGKGVANGYFGNVGDITAQTISNIHVEGSAGDMSASRISKIDVEGNLTSAVANSINNLFVGGSVTAELAAAKLSKAFIGGNVNELEGSRLSNVTVGLTVTQLNMQWSHNNKPGVISNSILSNITGHNIDQIRYIADADGGTNPVVVLNPNYNPVRIINSYVDLI